MFDRAAAFCRTPDGIHFTRQEGNQRTGQPSPAQNKYNPKCIFKDRLHFIRQGATKEQDNKSIYSQFHHNKEQGSIAYNNYNSCLLSKFQNRLNISIDLCDKSVLQMFLYFPICIRNRINEIYCVFILVLRERYCISEITYSWISVWRNLYFKNQSYSFSFARILAIQTVLLSRRIYPQKRNVLFEGFLYLCICAQEKMGY